jgi:hypothetical protein
MDENSATIFDLIKIYFTCNNQVSSNGEASALYSGGPLLEYRSS